MDPSEHLSISHYKTVMPINEPHNVYLVRHQESGNLFVKKTLDIYSPEVYRCLTRHPVAGIPRIIASCEEDGKLIVIEEFISGTTLRDKIATSRRKDSPPDSASASAGSSGPLTIEKIGRYMICLCEILEQLHSLDPPLIHRDIKPSNMMITNCDNVVLLDFNAARQYSGKSGRGADTKLLGTHGYAAPEQYGFAESSPQTDIYSVGIVLKEAVDSLDREDHTFDAVIAKCTRMEPSKRYSSASALKAAIQRSLERRNLKYRSPDRQSPDRRSLSRRNLGRRSHNQSPRPVVNPYLPPGFRTLHPWKMLTAILLYAVILYTSFTLQVENHSGAVLALERTGVFVIFLTDLFIAGDYLGIQRYAPFHQNPSRLLQLLGTAIMITIVTSVLFISLLLLVGILIVPH